MFVPVFQLVKLIYKLESTGSQEVFQEELGAIFVVHRIDRQTSGLILFAKTVVAHASLNSQFEGRTVEKVYQAIVRGHSDRQSGIIDLPLFENDKKGTMRVDLKHGKNSVTEFLVVEQFQGYALVEVRPKTGRLHQIRVHLAEIGLPILCDNVYGDGQAFCLSEIKPRYKMHGVEKPLLERTALHAGSLQFEHPTTHDRVQYSAELPKGMETVLKYLRKYRG